MGFKGAATAGTLQGTWGTWETQLREKRWRPGPATGQPRLQPTPSPAPSESGEGKLETVARSKQGRPRQGRPGPPMAAGGCWLLLGEAGVAHWPAAGPANPVTVEGKSGESRDSPSGIAPFCLFFRCHSARRPGARSQSCVRTADTGYLDTVDAS